MAMAKTPYLTKSRYVNGRVCEKWLWLGFHQPLPYEDPEPGSPAAVGTEIGIHAQKLFPGGVLVDTKPWEHQKALDETQAYMDDPAIPAVFEATFEFEDIRIRVDILERLGDNNWGIREVKSSSGLKEDYIHDIGVQVYVLQGCGLEIISTELIHVDTSYVLGDGGIDWRGYFARRDVSGDVAAIFSGIGDNAGGLLRLLDEPEAPGIEAGKHCSKDCPYWDHCTVDMPDDWINKLPYLKREKFEDLRSKGYQSISDIPDDYPLSANQEKVRQGYLTGETWISPGLHKALMHAGPPAFYLDFESMNPAVPIYPGTRPYIHQPFQWSLHHVDAENQITHQEFLADGALDPRRDFVETLLDALSGSDDPILVYSDFEKRTLRAMAALFPEQAENLDALVKRLVDLLPVVRNYIYHPAFEGSASIKYVAPALVPHLSYSNLDGIAEGAGASAAFARMAAGTLGPDESAIELRTQLLKYCELDTLALVEVHRALQSFLNS